VGANTQTHPLGNGHFSVKGRANCATFADVQSAESMVRMRGLVVCAVLAPPCSVNPVSDEFPDNADIQGIFVSSVLAAPFERLISLQAQSVPGELPAQRNREIYRRNRETNKEDKRTSPRLSRPLRSAARCVSAAHFPSECLRDRACPRVANTTEHASRRPGVSTQALCRFPAGKLR